MGLLEIAKHIVLRCNNSQIISMPRNFLIVMILSISMSIILKLAASVVLSSTKFNVVNVLIFNYI